MGTTCPMPYEGDFDPVFWMYDHYRHVFNSYTLCIIFMRHYCLLRAKLIIKKNFMHKINIIAQRKFRSVYIIINIKYVLDTLENTHFEYITREHIFFNMLHVNAYF